MARPHCAITLLVLCSGACADDKAATDVTTTRDDADSGETADTSAGDTSAGDADSSIPDTFVPDSLDASPGDSEDTSDTSAPDTAEPAPVWDLAMIRDASTAACTYTNARTTLDDGVLLDVWDVSYRSWESIDGVLQPITIRGFAARPASATVPLPGVVQAHGLGGYAEPSHATGLAALLGTFVIAYTGPGGGTDAANTSEGRASGYDSGRRMFDTLTDPRGSWFWGHAVAAMRAITCLTERLDVDATRIGMTGFSAGAVATLTVAGVDDRLIAAVPLSGTLAWDVATLSPSAWQHGLLQLAGLDITSPAWTELMRLLDPTSLLADTSTAIFMVNGTTDEFFPLTAHVATFNAIGSHATRRTSLAGNFDHGCYALSGVESAATIEARADLHARGAQRMWFGHYFKTDARYAELPTTPTVSLTAVGVTTAVVVDLDEELASLDVAEVKLWWSGDDALVWGSNALTRQAPGVWGAIVPVPLTDGLLSYVDVEYTTGEVLGAQHFTVSSRPSLPAGHVPKIRTMTTCLPP